MLFVEVFGLLVAVVRTVDWFGSGLFLGVVSAEASTAGNEAFVDFAVGVFCPRAVVFTVEHYRFVVFDAASFVAPVGFVVVVHLWRFGEMSVVELRMG